MQIHIVLVSLIISVNICKIKSFEEIQIEVSLNEEQQNGTLVVDLQSTNISSLSSLNTNTNSQGERGGSTMKFLRPCSSIYIDQRNPFRILSSTIDREQLCPYDNHCHILCHLFLQLDQQMLFIKLQININDINDHKPTFAKQFYSYDILYENLLDKKAFHLELEQAKDQDLSPRNSITHYYLNTSQQLPEKKFPFALDYNKQNHLLHLKLVNEEVNIEELESEYVIELVVVDGQNEQDHCSIQINIQKQQQQQNQQYSSPIFTQQLYQFHILNQHQIYSSLGQVYAQNPSNQTKQQQQIYYRLVSSSSSNANLFSINQTNGHIYLNHHQLSSSSLDQFYELLVEAFYFNYISSLTTVHIYFNFTYQSHLHSSSSSSNHHHLQQNEHFIQMLIPKRFQNHLNHPNSNSDANSNEILLQENSSVPLTLLQLFISSSSSSSSSLSKLEMNISNDERDYFHLKQLDEQSYELVLIKSLDYELIHHMSLDFILSSTTKSLQIFIQNINDCSPTFNQSIYTFHINENNPAPLLLHTFQAQDQDNLDHNIIYQLQITDDDKEMFEINATTGQLWIRKAFDRESKAKYTLSVCAFDQLYRTCSFVELDIVDENDNSCRFNSSSLVLSIEENLLSSTNITQIQALDFDENEYGRLSYRFSSQTSYLSIHSQTGVIQTTSMSFDYESLQQYSIDIIACDNIHSYPSLCCSLKLILNIIDLNDNQPYLIYPSSSDQIFIINYSNKTMPKLQAFDNDIYTPLIYFVIIGGSLNASLSIDYHSGQLSLLPPIHLPLYGSLMISLSSQTTVHLTILIHDNQTNPHTYLMSLQQQQPSSSSSFLFTYSYLFYFISFLFLIFVLLIVILIYCYMRKHQLSKDNDRLMATPSTTTLSTKSISTSTTNNTNPTKKLYETYYSFGDSVLSSQVIYV